MDTPGLAVGGVRLRLMTRLSAGLEVDDAALDGGGRGLRAVLDT